MNICFKDGTECKENYMPESKKVSIFSSPVSSYLNNKLSQEIEKYGFWQECILEKHDYKVERIILPYDTGETLCNSLCRKVLQSEIVVIDLTFRDPHVLSALFLARETGKIVRLMAHASSKLLHDFDGNDAVAIYGDNSEGLRGFCAQLEHFIKNLPEIKPPNDKVMCENPIKIPTDLKKEVPLRLEDLTNKKAKENPYWSKFVALSEQNDTLFNLKLSNLKDQLKTVRLENNILSFLLPENLKSHYKKNQRYYRCLFEKVIFALTGKDIIVKVKTKPFE